MKKFIFCALAALLVAPFAASAQSQNFAQKPRVEAGHSVSLDLMGLHYGYELPVSRTFSLIGRVGGNFGATWYNSRGGNWRTGNAVPWGDYWMITPSVEIEPRWYYGLDRRERHGRSSFGNAGSFVSVNIQSRFPGYISDKGFDMDGVTFFSPTWGMRRMWGGHWMFEFTAGARLGVTHDGHWWKSAGGISCDKRTPLDYLNFNVRFGYSF